MSPENTIQLIIGAPGIISMLWLAAKFFIEKTSQDQAEDEVSAAVTKLEKDRLDPLRKTVIDHDRRIIAIERDINALPQVDEVAKLNDKISDIAGDVKALAAEIRSLHQSQDRSERALQLVTESLMTPKS
jgi:outer membrane murein-binding lipoprotein Lpp